MALLQSDKQPKRALGRGLSALIPQAAVQPVTSNKEAPVRSGGVLKLAVEAIKRDPRQPRRVFDSAKLQELADSIKTQGLLQPVLVRKEGAGYELIACERRWRASQLAGLKEIPALIRYVSDAEAFEVALVENLQREDLNPMEEAEGYRRLIEEFGLTQERVSQRVGKDRSTVANALRLLTLPNEVKAMLSAGTIDMGHARALLGVPRIPEMVELAQRVGKERLSVRDTERLVKERKAAAGPAPASTSTSSKKPGSKVESRALLEELQRLLGTKVRLVEKGKGSGTLEIDYYSFQDLDRLLGLLRR